MRSIGTALGLIEFFGTVIVLLLLLGASLAKRGRITTFVVLAIVFGIVFANPFGIVARQSLTDPRPTSPTAAADSATHWVKVAGIPVLWFKPYSQKYVYSGENSPTAALKLRYGFSFLPSTGASTVVGMCSNSITDPCWKDGDYPLIQQDASGKTWIVPLSETPFGNPIQYLHVPHFYDVHFGVVSHEAFIYWLIVAVLIGAAVGVRRSSVNWRRVGLAAAGSVAVGVVIAGVLSVAATPARSAGDVEPELIPKAKPVAPANGTTTPTLISDQGYDADCIEKDGRTTTFFCKRADQLSSVQIGGGILALWTASPHRQHNVELRARRLTLSGKPVGPSRAVLPVWSATAASKPGFVNCAQPIDLQAAPINGKRVLVAWSDRCIIYDRTHPDPIHGLVVDQNGQAIGKPFDIVSVESALSSETAPEFALASTAEGRPLLAWVAKPKGSQYGESIFSSYLDSRNRATAAHELAQQGGQMAAACAATCAVAVPNTGGFVHLMFVSAGGDLASTSDVQVGNGAISSSAPTLTARDDDFYVGWIESQSGVSGTAKIARVRAGGVATTSTVWANFSTGQSSSPTTPKPLGIGFVAGAPTLVWQVIAYTGREANSQLYIASPGSRTSRHIDPYLSEGSVPSPPAGSLVAVGSARFAQPDPVSIALAQP